jgi:hypothetical protein
MDEKAEEIRVGLLSCTNATNDNLMVVGLNNINMFMNEVRNDPQNVVSSSFDRMNLTQSQTLGSIAAMGNTPATISALSKQIFSGDFQAITSKTSELGYLKAAQITATDCAVMAQYYVGSKPDMPKFRDDLQTALARSAGNVGYQQGAAAAKAAPAPAHAGADAPMG